MCPPSADMDDIESAMSQWVKDTVQMVWLLTDASKDGSRKTVNSGTSELETTTFHSGSRRATG